MNEIVFIIEPNLSFQEKGLVITLSWGLKEGIHFSLSSSAIGLISSSLSGCDHRSCEFCSSSISSQELTIAKWRSLCVNPCDQKVLDALIQEEMAYQKQKTGRTPFLDTFLLKTLHVSSKKSFSICQLLASAKHVYCGNKSIVIDCFDPVEFYYAGYLKGDVLEIEGRLRLGDNDVALSECLTIGYGQPHHWFIKGVSLKFIHTEISWNRLAELKERSLFLEKGFKQAFLSSLEEEDSPKLVMKEGSLEELSCQTLPLPVLQLKDRYGASADLLFDYGGKEYVAFHDSSMVFQGIKRQREAEKAFEKDLLETAYEKKIALTSHYFCPLDKISKSLGFLLEIGWKVRDVSQREVVKQSDWHIDVTEKDKNIALTGTLCFEGFKADISKVALAFNRREKFVSLSPQTVGLLSEDALSASWQEILSEGEMGVQEVFLKKNCLGLLSSVKNLSKGYPSLDRITQGWENFQNSDQEFPYKDFSGTLRPYQQQGVEWLLFLEESGFHGILADEMGLGKTVTLLAFLSRIPKEKLLRNPHLIIVPTSLLFNWRSEIEKFLPSFSCIIHEGNKRTKSKEVLEKGDIIVTSYAILRQDLSLFQSLTYHCLVLDEAQMIKNAHTQTAEAVCSLDAQCRLCVTGTPVENRLDELWSHFHFLMPDLLGSENDFQTAVQASKSDMRHLSKIKKKIAPFILRRKKEQVARDLPDLVEQTVFIEMSDLQRQCYEELLSKFKSGLMKKVALDGIKTHRLEVLEAILRLRQVCCHPLLVSSLIESSGDSAKCEALFCDLETIVEEGHKALIYSQFTSMLHIMTRKAQEKGWKFCLLEGATKNREEMVTQFQKDSETQLFFMSLKAGGVGLNLTAADYVYLYDPWWNNAAEAQAIGRAHRIGRDKTIFAKRFITLESIEEKMIKLKAEKTALIQNLFDDESSFVNWTIEDLYALIY